MSAGRPRDFDIEHALNEAMLIFWRKGFEGTSLADLTEAMGINRPSLYAAFGNKEELFLKVLDRYGEQLCIVRQALAEPTAKQVAHKLLHGLAEAQTDAKTPRGCLNINGALVCGSDAEKIRDALAARRAAGEAQLCERFKQAQTEGDLPPWAKPDQLARYISAVSQGMAVQAASGTDVKALKQIAEMALKAWPA